jgi:hypothetical protein
VGPQGVRVVDRGAVHQDHAVAVRMVVAALAGGRADDTGISIGSWGGKLSDLRAGRCGRCGVYHVGACAAPGVWKPVDFALTKAEAEGWVGPSCRDCGGRHGFEDCPASRLRRAEIAGDRLERALGEGARCKQCGSRHRGAACATPE